MKVYIVPGLWVPAIRGIFLAAGYDLTYELSKADIVVWTGGADVNPEIYGERCLDETQPWPARDEREKAVFNMLPKQGGPLKVGICRGAQLLCALSGGKLWQDVDNHGSSHEGLDIATGELVTLSSLHHQAMIPPAESFAWCLARESHVKIKSDGGCKYTVRPDGTKYSDIEALWIPATDSFCFQPHPEIGPASCTQYFFELIDRALLKRCRPPVKIMEMNNVPVEKIE